MGPQTTGLGQVGINFNPQGGSLTSMTDQWFGSGTMPNSGLPATTQGGLPSQSGTPNMPEWTKWVEWGFNTAEGAIDVWQGFQQGKTPDPNSPAQQAAYQQWLAAGGQANGQQRAGIQINLMTILLAAGVGVGVWALVRAMKDDKEDA